ncbi:MAG: hypothetical protein LAN84_17225 [Acidobacteriia bacterium]|nr:hypothetical protein [Terriglobia bacterium]
MTTEPVRVKIRIQNDSRLLAGLGGAIAHCACLAGLCESAAASLRAAALGVCQEAFRHLPDSRALLEVAITLYSDRLEVALSQPGSAAPVVGLDTLSGLAEQGSGAQNPFLAGGVDRVQYDVQGGVACTRLTKYLVPSAPSS